MLFMIVIKGSRIAETNLHIAKDLREKMDEYNTFLSNRGVKVMAKGLHPTHVAHRIKFEKDGNKVREVGPFMPYEAQIEGFFLIECKDMDEALYYFNLVPDPVGFGEGLIELRPVIGA